MLLIVKERFLKGCIWRMPRYLTSHVPMYRILRILPRTKFSKMPVCILCVLKAPIILHARTRQELFNDTPAHLLNCPIMSSQNARKDLASKWPDLEGPVTFKKIPSDTPSGRQLANPYCKKMCVSFWFQNHIKYIIWGVRGMPTILHTTVQWFV